MNDVIAKTGSPRITQGSRVTLHFSLLFDGGREIDSTRDGKPASFVVGDGNLLPGFEAVLMGRQAGYAEQIVIPAAQAFGEHNPDNVQLIERTRFRDLHSPGDNADSGQVGLEDGLQEGLVVSFQAPDGELPGVIVGLYERTVKVDFNHPLSGKDITFDVAVLKVEEPG